MIITTENVDEKLDGGFEGNLSENSVRDATAGAPKFKVVRKTDPIRPEVLSPTIGSDDRDFADEDVVHT